MTDTATLRALAERVSKSAVLPGGIGASALQEWTIVTPATVIALLNEIEQLRAKVAGLEKDAGRLDDCCAPNHLCGERIVHLPTGEQCDKCGGAS